MTTFRGIVRAAGWVLGTLAFAMTASAQKTTVESSALKWGPAPDVFPAGAKMAVERGDPMKSGEFVVRLAFPAGYRTPPHWHPSAEQVRVRSGELLVGMGDVLDPSKTRKMAPGDTGTIPPTMHHFAIVPVATQVSVRAEGPFAMTYVNPSDDPRTKKH